MHRFLSSVLAAALVAPIAGVAPAPASAAPLTQHVRGVVASASATSLTVTTASGPVVVALTPKTAIVGATAGSVADITPGKFLGIASAPSVGANRALEVTIFADALRGAAEGDYPWDSGTSSTHSMMTNGTVAMKHSTMTNATAGTISGSAQKTIVMAYKGGTRTLIVPAATPVVHVAPGTRALLVPGAAVFVIATKTAKPVAAFVVAGINGTKPPM
jgi:hypothetical protein